MSPAATKYLCTLRSPQFIARAISRYRFLGASRSPRVTAAPSMSDPRLLNAAATMGWGFRSLFDTPEVINVVQSWRLESERDAASYWRQVLLYSAQGNLQAMLDEYLHMLREWMLGGRRGVHEAASLAGAAAEALAFRTVTFDAGSSVR